MQQPPSNTTTTPSPDLVQASSAPSSFAVAVFCAWGPAPEEHQLAARCLGQGIGTRGWSLVWGGGTESLMGSVSAAAREHGGPTIGVLPSAYMSAADAEATTIVPVPDLATRKAEMARRADAYVVLPGGLGTCDELIDVWAAKAAGEHQKPVVLINLDGHWNLLLDWVQSMVDRGVTQAATKDAITVVDTSEAALDALDEPSTAQPAT